MKKLVVGPYKTKVLVHANLLEESELLNYEDEDSKHKIPLVDANHLTVEEYLTFLYTDKVLTKPGEDMNDHWVFALLVGYFVFGEKYKDIRFKNTVIDALYSMFNNINNGKVTLPTVRVEEGIRELYHGTPASSRVREMVVAFYATAEDGLKHAKETNNIQFYSDVKKAVRDGEEPEKRSSVYHEEYIDAYGVGAGDTDSE